MLSVVFTIVVWLLPVIVIAFLLIFWAWMFRDMQNNPDIPPFSAVVVTWPPQSKTAWTYAFFFFSLFTPAYYYFSAYRPSLL